MIPDHKKNGKWMERVNTRGGQGFTHMGAVWRSIVARCSPRSAMRRQSPAYAGCKLHRDWAEFQPFAIWHSSQPGHKLGYEVDKDLLLPGNMVYGPKRCCLLPRAINGAIRVPKGRLRLPGTTKLKSGWSSTGVGAYLGMFPTELEAHQAYCLNKEEHVRKLAAEYKDTISPAAYEALQIWRVHPDPELAS